MKKRICTLLSFIAMMFLMTSISTFAANGDEFTEGNWSYTVTGGTNVSIKPIDKNTITGKVTIPGSVNKGGATYSVTSIGWQAFDGCTSLTSVTIPDSVTDIGKSAFAWCEGLTSVTIPNRVTEIGGFAFVGCERLTSVTIPDSVTSIGLSAFNGCERLTSVTIPDSVTTIGDMAFLDCKRLKTVVIGNSVTSIGYGAFYSCSGLETVFYKDGLDVSDTEISKSATQIVYEISNEKSTPIEIKPTSVTWGKGVNSITVCNHMVGPYYKLVAPSPDNKATEDLTVDNTWNSTTGKCKTCGKECTHNWNAATCESPKTCSACGKTEGFELGHKWNDATCESPKTCSACGKTEGPALGHNWNPSTGTCAVCGAINPNSPTRLQATIENVYLQNLQLIVESPIGVLPEGTQLVAECVKPGTERHQELSAMRDEKYTAEYIVFLEITLRDKDGNILPMPLKDKVHVLLQLPAGYDKDDMQVALIKSDADVEFSETIETINGVDYISYWSDHFSPYAFVDTLSAEEKIALNNSSSSTSGTASAKATPKTGDNYIEFYITLSSLMVAAAALILLNRKKHCVK